MEILNYSNVEAQVLSYITEHTKTTIEEITEKMSFGEKTILSILSTLVVKKIIKLENGFYSYEEEKVRKTVILHGNLLLPVTILKKSDCILVCRGKWYKFPADFDISQIVWNVDLSSVNGEKTSLIELIENQATTLPTTKIKQDEDYKMLQEKIVPYNDKIDLLLKVIGTERTSVHIILKQKLFFDKVSTDHFVFREFKVPSQIDTEELLEQLRETDTTKRDYSKIKIQTIIQLSDIINNGNAIPINTELDKITYIKIKRDRQKLVLDYKTCDSMGVVTDLTSEEYLEISDGITVIENNLSSAVKILSNANILLENA